MSLNNFFIRQLFQKVNLLLKIRSINSSYITTKPFTAKSEFGWNQKTNPKGVIIQNNESSWWVNILMILFTLVLERVFLETFLFLFFVWGD